MIAEHQPRDPGHDWPCDGEAKLVREAALADVDEAARHLGLRLGRRTGPRDDEDHDGETAERAHDEG
ncbi:hypothetical protein JYT86_00255 [bacterium AH-315-N03]|nr:hypothetical protein [bacterium AH-315-N03]